MLRLLLATTRNFTRAFADIFDFFLVRVHEIELRK
jgi:hypothetical protein